MSLHVTNAKYIEDYKIKVSFNDGRNGVADLTDALHGSMFEALKNISEFANFEVDDELETIVWANGADLAPEYIYFKAFQNEPALQSQFEQWGYVA